MSLARGREIVTSDPALALLGAGCAAMSVGAFLVEVFGWLPMSFALSAISFPALMLLLVMFVWTGRIGRNGFVERCLVGLVAGIAATIAYDLLRWALQPIFDTDPFRAHPLFGSLILGTSKDSNSALVAGWVYHAWNGVSFGIMYALIAGGSRWFWAVAWGLALESATVAAYPAEFGIGRWDTGFVGISLSGHLAYGTTLGILSQRWLRDGPHRKRFPGGWPRVARFLAVPTAARVPLLLVAASLAAFATTSGAASADDCSSPGDCSNTAWTVGGGAAAAAALVAAAAASGWMPKPEGLGGSELNPECKAELTKLAQDVRAQYARCAEVAVARQGAKTKLVQGMAAANLFRDMSADVISKAQKGDYDWGASIEKFATGATDGGTNFGAKVDAGTLWGNTATATGMGVSVVQARTQKAAADAVGAYEQAIGRLASLRRNITRNDFKLDAYKQLLDRQSFVNRGLGIYSVGSTAWGTFRQTRKNDALVAAGVMLSRGDQEREAANRWASYLAELDRRAAVERDALEAAMRAYNAKAFHCMAEPIQIDGNPLLDPPEASASAPGGGLVPPSVTGPEPVRKTKFRPTMGCDDYEESRLAYERQLQGVKDDIHNPSGAVMIAEQRIADIAATMPKLEEVIAAVQSQYTRECARFTVEGFVSGMTSIVALFTCITPAGGVVLGIASLVSGLAQGFHSPEEWNTIYLGAIIPRRAWLESRLAYWQAESNRAADLIRDRAKTLKYTYDDLNRQFTECAGTEQGWVQATSPVGLDLYMPPHAGTARSLQEIATWH